MKVVFIGSLEFSWFVLKEILEKNLADIIGVFNVDHKYSKSISDYRNQLDLAKKYKLPHHFFHNINDEETVGAIRKLQPDLILVFGLSQIIQKELLDIPKMGLLGTHPSLLPKNRGRASIPWSIINGLKKSGLTFFYLVEDADGGDIVDQMEWSITSEDDASSIYKKMIDVGIMMIDETLPLIASGKEKRVKQTKSGNWWPGRKPEDGKIDWNQSYMGIDRLIRATTKPYPGAFTKYDEKNLIIWKCKPQKDASKIKNGTVIKKNKSGLLIKAKGGAILATVFEPKDVNVMKGDILL